MPGGGILDIRVQTRCGECSEKCCSQTHDWVYLTSREAEALAAASGRPVDEFVTRRRNDYVEHEFKVLALPCPFLDKDSGECTVYDARPLVCRLYPLYPEPFSGDVCLLPGQCDDRLEVLKMNDHGGWTVRDYDAELRTWFRELWSEARTK